MGNDICFNNVVKAKKIYNTYVPLHSYFKIKNKAEKFLTEIQEDGYWGYITEKMVFIQFINILFLF